MSNLPKTRYTSQINVVPKVPYTISIEFLQPPKTTSNPIVTNIMVDNFYVGDCTPEGITNDCAFLLCKTTEKRPIISETGTIDISIEFKDHSWKCSCDIRSWNCNQHVTSPTLLPMVAVARITLKRQPSFNNSGNKMF